MRTGPEIARDAVELLDDRPMVVVPESEYRRLLGYPKGHRPSDRALELAHWARRTFAEHGRPWVYLREAEMQIAEGEISLEGVAVRSRQFRDHLVQSGARRAVLAAVSAGSGCEEEARRLWQEGKPDEYFFLEVFGSAVVEHLVDAASGRVCDLAEKDGLMAIPPYSPGYTGWDVADQNALFDLIVRGRSRPFPEPIEVLSSGMLRPKKSLLTVFGLTPRTPDNLAKARLVPCENCSYSPCQYRRARYCHDLESGRAASSAGRRSGLTPKAAYSVNPRALSKWAGERVRLEPGADGRLSATFRFDGTTCSNMGRPIAFDYAVTLGRPDEGYPILQADCRPAPEDEGHRFMCAYLADADSLMRALASEKPLLGHPLDDVLAWSRIPAPSGCHCDAGSRAHKWGLALEAIHFAIARSESLSTP